MLAERFWFFYKANLQRKMHIHKMKDGKKCYQKKKKKLSIKPVKLGFNHDLMWENFYVINF